MDNQAKCYPSLFNFILDRPYLCQKGEREMCRNAIERERGGIGKKGGREEGGEGERDGERETKAER